jgi:hypothetical protein
MLKDNALSFAVGALAFLAAGAVGKWMGFQPSLMGGGVVVTTALGKVFYDQVMGYIAKKRDPLAPVAGGSVTQAAATLAGGAAMFGGGFVG